MKIVRSIVVDRNNPGPRSALLDWETVTHKFSWGIVLLLGGGYALALACEVILR